MQNADRDSKPGVGALDLRWCRVTKACRDLQAAGTPHHKSEHGDLLAMVERAVQEAK